MCVCAACVCACVHACVHACVCVHACMCVCVHDFVLCKQGTCVYIYMHAALHGGCLCNNVNSSLLSVELIMNVTAC